MQLRVKSSGNQGEDKLVTVEDGTHVQALKSLIYEKFNIDPNSKTLRLIYSGKLLEPITAPISQFNLKPDAVVHAVFSAKSPMRALAQGDVEMNNLSNTGYLPVAQELSPEAAAQNGVPLSLGGFNRLIAERGIDEVQIAAMRSFFAPDIAALASRMARHDGEDDTAFQERVEEIWMDSQSPNSDFNLNLPPRQSFSEQELAQVQGFLQRHLLFSSARTGGLDVDTANIGSMRDLLLGIFLGFLFGGIAILCVWDRNMSYRQKVGILLGVMLSLAFTILAPAPTATATKT